MTQQQSEPCVADSCEQAGPHERGEVCPTDREERYWQAAYNAALEDAAKVVEDERNSWERGQLPGVQRGWKAASDHIILRLSHAADRIREMKR